MRYGYTMLDGSPAPGYEPTGSGVYHWRYGEVSVTALENDGLFPSCTRSSVYRGPRLWEETALMQAGGREEEISNCSEMQDWSKTNYTYACDECPLEVSCREFITPRYSLGQPCSCSLRPGEYGPRGCEWCRGSGTIIGWNRNYISGGYDHRTGEIVAQPDDRLPIEADGERPGGVFSPEMVFRANKQMVYRWESCTVRANRLKLVMPDDTHYHRYNVAKKKRGPQPRASILTAPDEMWVAREPSLAD